MVMTFELVMVQARSLRFTCTVLGTSRGWRGQVTLLEVILCRGSRSRAASTASRSLVDPLSETHRGS